jgi:hypothetical protein
MKKADLKPGMRVEIKTSNYHLPREAMILDLAQWEYISWKGEYQPAGRFAKKGAGAQYPVAVCTESYPDYESPENPGPVVRVWRPRLARLREIVPVGSRAAERSTAARLRAERDEQNEKRAEMEAAFVSDLSLEPGDVKVSDDMTRVTIPVSKLEHLVEIRWGVS